MYISAGGGGVRFLYTKPSGPWQHLQNLKKGVKFTKNGKLRYKEVGQVGRKLGKRGKFARQACAPHIHTYIHTLFDSTTGGK